MQTPLECCMIFSDFNQKKYSKTMYYCTIFVCTNQDGSHNHLLLTTLDFFNKSLNQKIYYLISDEMEIIMSTLPKEMETYFLKLDFYIIDLFCYHRDFDPLTWNEKKILCN